MRRLVHGLALALGLVAVHGGSCTARAHFSANPEWPQAHRKLHQLFPTADPNGWKIKRHRFDDEQAAALEKQLKYALYPADRDAVFYIAQDREGQLLGVAVLLDPRPTPKVVDGAVVPLEVGVAVDAKGSIQRMHVYGEAGKSALGEATFLDQFIGRTLGCTFKLGKKTGLQPAPDAEDSQLVANAARESLLLMNLALGRGAPLPACPK
ncbi:MAG: hypothetical protein AAF721_04675 [Myxococcota bacterium]